MGNPIRTGTTPMSDVLVAAITRSIGLTLGDRSGGGLLANPVLAGQFLGATRLGAALGTKMVDVGWGLNKFVSEAQGTDFTVETLSSAAATVTPARRGMARQVSDMARALQSMDELAYVQFINDQTIAWQQSVVSLIASLFPSFSASGGVSGGTATWASIVAAYQTLGIAKSAGPYVLVLRPKDWANVASDAFALGGRERAGAAESGEDLVEDQMHAVAAAELRDGPQEAGRLLDHAGGALHQRLKDDAGRRGSVTDQQGFQRGQRGGGVGADDLAGAFGVDRRRERLRGEEPGLEAAVELRASPD